MIQHDTITIRRNEYIIVNLNHLRSSLADPHFTFTGPPKFAASTLEMESGMVSLTKRTP